MVVRDVMVHDGAVSVAIDVGLKAMESLAPSHLAHFLGGDGPLAEAREMPVEASGDAWGGKVQERVAKAEAPAEIHGNVQKVETT